MALECLTMVHDIHLLLLNHHNQPVDYSSNNFAPNISTKGGVTGPIERKGVQEIIGDGYTIRAWRRCFGPGRPSQD